MRCYRVMIKPLVCACVIFLALLASKAEVPHPASEDGFQYIDTSFENASPIWYERASDGTILIYLLYDLERSSPNRAAGHFHFQIQARAGTKLTLEFKNLDNVWNGR